MGEILEEDYAKGLMEWLSLGCWAKTGVRLTSTHDELQFHPSTPRESGKIVSHSSKILLDIVDLICRC
jgi:hypothetical protein